MTRIATDTVHPYHSELRAEQAEATRERILEATTRVAGAGLAVLSIPTVARQAGVSVPTIYRHFKTKADLLKAVYPHLARRAGLTDLTKPVPASVDEFREMVRMQFRGLDSLGEVARAAFASPGSDEGRRLSMPTRIAMSRHFVDSVARGASRVDRERISRLLLILTSSAAMRTWRDHLGATVDEAADDVDWVLRAMLAAATQGKGK